jgi:hypothetical protein
MKMTNLLLAFGLVLAGTAAQAAEFGAAGCGLGSMAFHDQPGFIQVVAATLNSTAANQTFGITTGTSNCGPGVFTSQMDIFVDSNKVALSNDAARGQGETIAVVSKMMGCTDSAVVGTTLKSNYSEIFAEANDSRAISKAIQSKLQGTCGT